MLRQFYFWIIRNFCNYQTAPHYVHPRRLGETLADSTGTVQYIGNGIFRVLKKIR